MDSNTSSRYTVSENIYLINKIGRRRTDGRYSDIHFSRLAFYLVSIVFAAYYPMMSHLTCIIIIESERSSEHSSWG